MPVILYPGHFEINRVFRMAYADVPAAVAAHLALCPTTPAVEFACAAYVGGGFVPAGANHIVMEVCRWGGRIGPFVATRILNRNRPANIAQALCRAYHAASAAFAITEVQGITGLGISFGSKHLRMMNPSDRVVLDRILSSDLHYRLDAGGYAAICADCKRIAAELQRRLIVNPMDGAFAAMHHPNPRGRGTTWWPADVELALFAKARGWTQQPVLIGGPPTRRMRGRDGAPNGANGASVTNWCYEDGSFDDFWSWLSTARKAPTLAKQSVIEGQTSARVLTLTSSKGRNYKVNRDTVAAYCATPMAERTYGNKRWVRALLVEYLC